MRTTKTDRRGSKRPQKAISVVGAVALLLGACADGDGSDTAGAETAGSTEAEGGGSDSGVEVGASQEDYAAALEDMEPIELHMSGLIEPEGGPTAESFVAWGDAIEEWSGGKITFRYDYGMAEVPLHEVGPGLAEGRTDAGLHIPQYAPDEWPLTSAAIDHFFVGDPGPIAGGLQRFAASLEFGRSQDAMIEEHRQQGIEPLYPLFAHISDARTICAGDAITGLDAASGTEVRIPGAGVAQSVQTIGGTPVSLVIGEAFEGLQRGVVDCAIGSVSGHIAAGFHEVTDVWMFGENVDFGDTPSAVGISSLQWESLPLAAQQLLWDTQTVFLENMMEARFASLIQYLQISVEAGVEFAEFGAEIEDALQEDFDQRLSGLASMVEEQGLIEDGEGFVQELQDTHDRWWTIVVDELGYDDETTWADMVDVDPADIDVAPLAERIYEEVLLPDRP